MELLVELSYAGRYRDIERLVKDGQIHNMGKLTYVDHMRASYTPLGWLLADHCTYLPLIEACVAHGSDPNEICFKDTRTWERPLHTIAASNRTRTFRYLVSLGADHRMADSSPKLPYDVARIYNCKETIALCAVLDDRCDALVATYWVISQLPGQWPDMREAVVRILKEIPLDSWNTEWWKRLKRK